MENPKKDKFAQKKKKKEGLLLNSAFELFTTKGTNNTAIDDIVKKAGVAKGTFYLYFKDKYDIINRLILKESSKVIKEAFLEMKKNDLQDIGVMTLFFINFIIDYFKENKLILKLINKNFSVGIYRRALLNPEENIEVNQLITNFINALISKGYSLEDAKMTLFMLFELVGSVCYSSIILEEPSNIEDLKPLLFKKVLLLVEV